MIEREKFYGCKSAEDSDVKIVEEWIVFKKDGVRSYKYTAYFGDCEKGFDCFKNWRNPVEADVSLRLYLKTGNKWEGVVYKHIDKDNVDDTDAVLKSISDMLDRDINNEDMFDCYEEVQE